MLAGQVADLRESDVNLEILLLEMNCNKSYNVTKLMTPYKLRTNYQFATKGRSTAGRSRKF